MDKAIEFCKKAIYWVVLVFSYIKKACMFLVTTFTAFIKIFGDEPTPEVIPVEKKTVKTANKKKTVKTANKKKTTKKKGSKNGTKG